MAGAWTPIKLANLVAPMHRMFAIESSGVSHTFAVTTINLLSQQFAELIKMFLPQKRWRWSSDIGPKRKYVQRFDLAAEIAQLVANRDVTRLRVSRRQPQRGLDVRPTVSQHRMAPSWCAIGRHRMAPHSPPWRPRQPGKND